MPDDFLRKQAWDYFQLHANQRLAVFNFYIVISSVTATAYFSSFKSDSNLQHARPALAAILCISAFVFWKLDQRTKALVKNAERALKFYESKEDIESAAKVFTQEELDSHRAQRWFCLFIPWRWRLSYSDCFNFVFLGLFHIGPLRLHSMLGLIARRNFQLRRFSVPPSVTECPIQQFCRTNVCLRQVAQVVSAASAGRVSSLAARATR